MLGRTRLRGLRVPEKAKGPRDRQRTLQRLRLYLHRQRKALIAATSATVAGSGDINLIGPYLIGRAIDGYILKHDLYGLSRIAAIMLASYVAGSILTWLQSYVMASVAQTAVRDIRTDLFAKLLTLPLPFFDKRAHVATLMSRLTNDVDNIQPGP